MKKHGTAKTFLALLLAVSLLAALFPVFAEDAQEPITIDNIRNYVVGVDEPVTLADGTTRPLINFDNAATTPALKPVMDEVNQKLLLDKSLPMHEALDESCRLNKPPSCSRKTHSTRGRPTISS